MKIKSFSLKPYNLSLTNGMARCGTLIHLIDEQGHEGWGDVAPLPKWSCETSFEAYEELIKIRPYVQAIEWNLDHLFDEIKSLQLFASVSFGLESALLSLMDPLENYSVPVSALFIGSIQEIFAEAEQRHREGFKSAKLKVSQLSFKEAFDAICQLKDLFRLRIDVNRAWTTVDSLQFFKQFPLDAFDYIEEPFQNPKDLAKFPHPLAVDESFPENLSLEELEDLPSLKALVYKPTIQGGIADCLPLKKWAQEKKIQLVLSSSFESDLGLYHIASMAHRLDLCSPIGIGTYHYLKNHIYPFPMQFSDSCVQIQPSFSNLTTQGFSS